MRLHLLITLVKSSEYFRVIESLRTCIMASQINFEFACHLMAFCILTSLKCVLNDLCTFRRTFENSMAWWTVIDNEMSDKNVVKVVGKEQRKGSDSLVDEQEVQRRRRLSRTKQLKI